jgi:hypothetical protein
LSVSKTETPSAGYDEKAVSVEYRRTDQGAPENVSNAKLFVDREKNRVGIRSTGGEGVVSVPLSELMALLEGRG